MIRQVTLVQQEHKLTLSEMREALRALKAATLASRQGSWCHPRSTASVCLWQLSGRGWCGRGWLCGRGVVALCGGLVTYITHYTIYTLL